MFSEYKRHAQDLIKTYDLRNIDSIVILSGDGTISEVAINIKVRVKNNYFGQLAKRPNTLKFDWPLTKAHLVGHEKLHDTLSI